MTQQTAARPGIAFPERMKLFLSAAAFDYLLVLVVSVGLVFTVSYGFNSAPSLRENLAVTTAACALLLVPLYGGSWSKRALVGGVVGYIAVAAIVVAVFTSLSPSSQALFVDGQINDVEDNYAIYGLVTAIIPLVAFLLGRKPWGVVLLLVAAALACGTIQFLYRDWLTAQPGTQISLAVFAAIVALLVVQGYRQSVLSADRAAKTSFGWSFVFGVGAACVCALAACALYAGVIANLGIQTVNIKPFQDYYKVPVIEYDGTYVQQEVIDPDVGTSTLSDDEEDTISNAQGAESDDENMQDSGGQSPAQTIVDALDLDDWSSMFDANRYDMPMSLRFLLALVPIALVAAIVFARYHVRARRLARFEKRDANARAVLFYDFFMSRFKRLGVKKAPALTPLEFAIASETELARFARNASRTDFVDVTLIFQRACYGTGNVSKDDCKRLRDYYESLFKNAHERMGTLKWVLWGFWRI